MRSSVATALLGGVLITLLGVSAAAAAPLSELESSCALRTSTGAGPVRYRICSAKVPSFDGTPLDTTLTLPARRPRRPLPLVVLLHGLLSSKGEYISETRDGTGPDRGADAYKTVHWNNVWFASRGYAVLDYSARGNGDSGGQLDLASKDVEVRDTRYLTGLLADDRGLVPIASRRMALIGGSYGGGQAWLAATTRPGTRGQFGQWRSPGGRLVRIAALLPGFTWTDLLYSIAPNGQQSSADAPNPLIADSPLGVVKQSIVSGFIVTGNTKFSSQIYGWLARASAGEPYDAGSDPILADAVRGLTYDRSAYFQDDFFNALRKRRQRNIPVFAAQGWTDPIFHPIEVIRMYRRLRSIRPHYPIKVYFGDMEHLTALDKVDEFAYYHGLGNRFIDHYLRRRPRRAPRFDVRAAVSNCDPKRFGPVLTAPRLDGLATSQRNFELGGPQTAISPLADPRGIVADPVAASELHGRGCITTTLPPTPGVATYTVPIQSPFTMVGLPRLSLRFTTTAPDVQLNSRLWDVAPDGTQTLVTRGARRDVLAAGTRSESYELFGNAWRFEAGHRLMLEIAPDDGPYLRPDNEPAVVSVADAELTLPVR